MRRAIPRRRCSRGPGLVVSPLVSWPGHLLGPRRATPNGASTVQRLLALILVLIGLTGLVLGRLGETTWAPETETTATVDLSDAGPAVVIDPGVLYVGGQAGELVIEGASDVSVITAGGGDMDGVLEEVHHPRLTGASDWTTRSTQEAHPDGEAELADPTSSALCRTVDTAPSPDTLDIHDFWAGENDDPNGEDNE